MKLLLFGATGMLGQALSAEARLRGYLVVGIARKNADVCIDITNDIDVETLIRRENPDVIINAAALINLQICSERPDLAYQINSRSVGVISNLARKVNALFVQISTDHYYTGDLKEKHSETSPIYLMNEYARTKYAGEMFALTNPSALVVRTNIVGFRGSSESNTFVEWVIDCLAEGRSITAFNDYYTSSIDVRHFSKILFDLLALKAHGTINVCSKEVYSKKEFIEELAAGLGYKGDFISAGSVQNIHDGICRAESLGLSTDLAEQLLGYEMPGIKDVISSLTKEYIEGWMKS